MNFTKKSLKFCTKLLDHYTLGEVYDLFEQVVRCNGAVFDGLYEPSNYLSTEKDQREQAKILGEKMFNSWKQQEKKFS